MHPLLREGDLLYYEEVPAARIGLGELICFKRGNKYLCHRLILKRTFKGKKFFLEKPDNSLRGASYIEPSDVLGRAVKVIRGGKEMSLHQGPLSRYKQLVKYISYRIGFYGDQFKKKKLGFITRKQR